MWVVGLQVNRLRQEVAEQQQRSEELLRARANAAAEQQAKDEEVKDILMIQNGTRSLSMMKTNLGRSVFAQSYAPLCAPDTK
jgi:hypothetical protein